MNVIINGEEYSYLKDLTSNESIRNSFIKLINDEFAFDFSNWYNLGFWTPKYEPHVLCKNGEVVATVTVNYMKYRFKERIHSYLQIGGVLTRDDYQKKGLSRWLMNQIMEQYREKCEQMFLFSDDVAVDFYPKMGFVKTQEYLPIYKWKSNSRSACEVKKLNISQPEDREILLHAYEFGNPFSRFNSVDCVELVVFYGIEFLKECYYYFPQYDLVAIGWISGDVLKLDDIYGSSICFNQTNATTILQNIVKTILMQNNCDSNNMDVELGFSPNETLPDIEIIPLNVPDDTTFILGDKDNIIEVNKLRFPVMSHN